MAHAHLRCVHAVRALRLPAPPTHSSPPRLPARHQDLSRPEGPHTFFPLSSPSLFPPCRPPHLSPLPPPAPPAPCCAALVLCALASCAGLAGVPRLPLPPLPPGCVWRLPWPPVHGAWLVMSVLLLARSLSFVAGSEERSRVRRVLRSQHVRSGRAGKPLKAAPAHTPRAQRHRSSRAPEAVAPCPRRPG